jgi:hypothetical protein
MTIRRMGLSAMDSLNRARPRSARIVGAQAIEHHSAKPTFQASQSCCARVTVYRVTDQYLVDRAVRVHEREVRKEKVTLIVRRYRSLVSIRDIEGANPENQYPEFNFAR